MFSIKKKYNKKENKVFFLQQPSKMPKGKKVAPAPAVVKKQEAKKVVNPLFERGPRTSALDRTSSPKEI